MYIFAKAETNPELLDDDAEVNIDAFIQSYPNDIFFFAELTTEYV